MTDRGLPAARFPASSLVAKQKPVALVSAATEHPRLGLRRVVNHPRQAWDEKLGCQCGAGMPCECQRASDLETPDVSKVLEGHDVQVER